MFVLLVKLLTTNVKLLLAGPGEEIVDITNKVTSADAFLQC